MCTYDDLKFNKVLNVVGTDKALTWKERQILSEIIFYHEKGFRGKCETSLSYLADKYDLDEANFSRTLHELEKKGYITIKETWEKRVLKKRMLTPTYKNFPENYTPKGGCQNNLSSHFEESSKLQGGGCQNYNLKKNYKEYKKQEACGDEINVSISHESTGQPLVSLERMGAAGNGEADFEGRFWPAYPKRVKKQDALKAWLQLNPGPELVEQILTAVQNHRRSEQWTKEDGQYIPYPATWLRGQQWTDEIATGPEPAPLKTINGKTGVEMLKERHGR